MQKWVAGAVMLLAAVIYIQVAGFDFVWDDNMFIVDSSKLRSDAWVMIFAEPFFVSDNYYRPLVLLSYLIDGRASNFSPAIMHLTNLVIYASNVCLVWFLARRFSSRTSALSGSAKELLPYFAAVFYLVHPANIESAVWISGRFDLMVTFFLLCAMAVDISGLRVGSKCALVYVFYLAACLSKEMAVTFPIVLFLWHLAIEGGNKLTHRQFWIEFFKRYSSAYFFVILAGLTYLVIRYFALGYLLVEPAVGYLGSELQHLLLVGKAFGMYLFSALLPFAYSAPIHKEYFPVDISDRLALVSLLVLIVSVLVSTYMIKRRAPYVLPYIIFVISLLPVLHLKPVPIDENIIQERFLAFPLVFLSFSVCLIVLRLSSAMELTLFAKRFVAAMFWGWVSMSVVVLSSQIPMWKNNLIFWTWAREKAPDSVVANGNLGATLLRYGQLDKAEYHAKLAYYLEEKRLAGSVLLANIYMEKKDFDQAQKYIERLLASDRVIKPMELKEAINTLGLIHMRRGEYDKAKDIFNDLLADDMYYQPAMVNLGTLMYCLGDTNGATEFWDKSLALMHRDQATEYRKRFDFVIAEGVECNFQSESDSAQ